MDFVDIDDEALNISVERFKEHLVEEKRNGTLPQVVVPVEFAGQSIEQEVIWSYVEEFGFKVIEGTSHAIGGQPQHRELVENCC